MNPSSLGTDTEYDSRGCCALLWSQFKKLEDAGNLKKAAALFGRIQPLADKIPGLKKNLIAALREESGEYRKAGDLIGARRRLECLLKLEQKAENWERLGEIYRQEAEDLFDRVSPRAARALLRSILNVPCAGEGWEVFRGYRFESLVSLGRYREAVLLGEQVLDCGLTSTDIGTFWHPWFQGLIPEVRREHLRILDRSAGGTH